MSPLQTPSPRDGALNQRALNKSKLHWIKGDGGSLSSGQLLCGAAPCLRQAEGEPRFIQEPVAPVQPALTMEQEQTCDAVHAMQLICKESPPFNCLCPVCFPVPRGGSY